MLQYNVSASNSNSSSLCGEYHIANHEKKSDSKVKKRKPHVFEAKVKTQICKHFEKGFCKLGKDCIFAHGTTEIRDIAPKTSKKNINSMPPPPSRAPNVPNYSFLQNFNVHQTSGNVSHNPEFVGQYPGSYVANPPQFQSFEFVNYQDSSFPGSPAIISHSPMSVPSMSTNVVYTHGNSHQMMNNGRFISRDGFSNPHYLNQQDLNRNQMLNNMMNENNSMGMTHHVPQILPSNDSEIFMQQSNNRNMFFNNNENRENWNGNWNMQNMNDIHMFVQDNNNVNAPLVKNPDLQQMFFQNFSRQNQQPQLSRFIDSQDRRSSNSIQMMNFANTNENIQDNIQMIPLNSQSQRGTQHSSPILNATTPMSATTLNNSSATSTPQITHISSVGNGVSNNINKNNGWATNHAGGLNGAPGFVQVLNTLNPIH